MAMVVPASSPAFSRTGPQAAAVPFPPTMGMEPQARPTSGSTPMTLQIMTPSPFWNTTRILDRIKNTITCGPPFLSSFQLAV